MRGCVAVRAKATEGAKVNYFTEMRSGSEEGSYLRLIDGGITQL
jgi:hypothetical protein